MTLLKLLVPVSSVALCLLFGAFEWSDYLDEGRQAPRGLRLEVISQDFNIGIPGQKKMYRGRLTNDSTVPVSLPACDYVDDAGGRGTELPYAVQRWDGQSNSWQTVVDGSGKGFCRPYPLGKVETHRVTMRLAPGATINATSEEATGAREPFRKGE